MILTSGIMMIFITIFIMVGVAFFTLLERKLLSYSQLRKGPNKVSLLGLLQPITDAVKLLAKSSSVLTYHNLIVFFLTPFLSLTIMLTLWSLYSSTVDLWNLFYSLLIFLCLSTLSIYPLFGSGWSSNSKYSFIGALRGAAQIVSYEIGLITIILFLFMFMMSYDLSMLSSKNWFLCLVAPLWVFFWFVLIVSETNRAPFDLAEGESELVSGFNTEYSSGGFAMIFLSEYGSIMFLSMFSSMLLISYLGNFFFVYFMSLMMCMLFVFVRSAFPRLRYDLFMMFSWQVLLLSSFVFLFFLTM